MPETGRSYSAGNQYRYGFQGHEVSTEINANSYTAEFWEYDARTGRRWNIDPSPKSYESVYASFSGNPIWFIDPNGKDTLLYRLYGGQLVDVKKGGMGKSPIYTVDDTYAIRHEKDIKLLWSLASPLKYKLGANSKNKGLTGKTLRKDHPLHGKPIKAGDQVYQEDLLDMTKQFDEVVKSGIPAFESIRSFSKGFGGKTVSMLFSTRSSLFKQLVKTGAPFDLKSENEKDGTFTFSGRVIGEYTILSNTLRTYDDYGNISFGILGTKAGFTQDELLYSSNVAQRLSTGDDDPYRDTKMIETGILYSGNYKK